MKPVERFKEVWGKVFKYVIFYVISMIVLGFVFSLVYKLLDVKEPIKISFSIAFNMESSFVPKAGCIERLLKMLIDFFLVAKLVSGVMAPTCPIKFSKYVTFGMRKNDNGKEAGCFIFRYWIMLRKKKFLHGAKIEIFLTNNDEFNRGVNNTKTFWHWDEKDANKGKGDSDDSTKLSLIRGIRYIEMPEDETRKLISSIERNWDEDGLCLCVAITASDISGNTFFAQKRYLPSNLLFGYEFAPVSGKDVYTLDILKTKPSVKHGRMGDTLSSNYNFVRSSNFDKYYRYAEEELEEEYLYKWIKNMKASPARHIQKDCLEDMQIIFGNEKGLKRIYTGIVNGIAWMWYSWNRSGGDLIAQIGDWIHFSKCRRQYKKDTM